MPSRQVYIAYRKQRPLGMPPCTTGSGGCSEVVGQQVHMP